MNKHEDLMTAALGAVQAIEARSDHSSPDSAPNVGNHDAIDDLDIDILFDDSSSEVDAIADEIEFELSNIHALLDAPSDGGVSTMPSDATTPALVNLSESSLNQEAIHDLETQLDHVTAQRDVALQKCTDLQNENDQMRAIQKQLNDRLIRMTADFDNYRKRITRDQELMKHQAKERIVTEFLPVMDNLERALTHARQSDDYEKLLQGVEMTGKLYLGVLAKFGCVPFDSIGKTFDPVYHDVLQRIVDSDKPHNCVVQEHLRGYQMHDRVLRPALVVITQHETPQDNVE